MAAVIVEACEAAKAVIEGMAAVVAAKATVERVYTFRGPEGDARIKSLQGRRVYLFPAAYEQSATVDRGIDAMDYLIKLLVIEVYKGGEAVPPNAWLDERVAFVDAIYRRLSDARGDDIGGRWLPQQARVEEVYSQEYLDELKAFVSYGEVTLREYAAVA